MGKEEELSKEGDKWLLLLSYRTGSIWIENCSTLIVSGRRRWILCERLLGKVIQVDGHSLPDRGHDNVVSNAVGYGRASGSGLTRRKQDVMVLLSRCT